LTIRALIWVALPPLMSWTTQIALNPYLPQPPHREETSQPELVRRTVSYRLANYETPLWSVENFSAGRYNESDAGFTQYLSLHPLTPWAELVRNEDRRTRARAVLLRYPLWAIRVQLAEEPFALTFDNAGEFGLTAEDLVSDDHGSCRALAQAFRQNGPQAFLAPSAALPGTTNLVVLEPRVLAPWNRIPLDDVRSACGRDRSSVDPGSDFAEDRGGARIHDVGAEFNGALPCCSWNG
jgi:hypothetical protein